MAVFPKAIYVNIPGSIRGRRRRKKSGIQVGDLVTWRRGRKKLLGIVLEIDRAISPDGMDPTVLVFNSLGRIEWEWEADLD